VTRAREVRWGGDLDPAANTGRDDRGRIKIRYREVLINTVPLITAQEVPPCTPTVSFPDRRKVVHGNAGVHVLPRSESIVESISMRLQHFYKMQCKNSNSLETFFTFYVYPTVGPLS
jgi:hypothetical protein